MTWVLLIQVLVVSTCADGFPFCPPPRPPVVTEQVVETQAACEARAQQMRRALAPRRVLVQSAHMTMAQLTTVQCVPRS